MVDKKKQRYGDDKDTRTTRSVTAGLDLGETLCCGAAVVPEFRNEIMFIIPPGLTLSTYTLV